MLAFARRALRYTGISPGWIPRGTCVDPAAFPEDEYPVCCLRCGYNLHGLPDGRCPECGDEFARGHLLVEFYARMRRPRTDRRCRAARILVWIGGTCLVACYLTALALPAAQKWWPAAADWLFDRIMTLFPVMLWTGLVASTCFFTASGLWFFAMPASRKRIAVHKSARARARERASQP